MNNAMKDENLSYNNWLKKMLIRGKKLKTK